MYRGKVDTAEKGHQSEMFAKLDIASFLKGEPA
jgi:hypothetical protein